MTKRRDRESERSGFERLLELTESIRDKCASSSYDSEKLHAASNPERDPWVAAKSEAILEWYRSRTRALSEAQRRVLLRRVHLHLGQWRPPEKKARAIILPPGARLNRITQFLLTREAHRLYVQPVIADMQTEYCDELAKGHLWHARWIAVRGHALILPGWLYGFLARAVKRLFSA